MKLPIILEDGEDGWIVATCPSLPGCVSQGRTRDEALAISVSGKEFIRMLLKRGWREIRQRGSHIIVQKDGEHRALSIPNHLKLAQEHYVHC